MGPTGIRRGTQALVSGLLVFVVFAVSVATMYAGLLGLIVLAFAPIGACQPCPAGDECLATEKGAAVAGVFDGLLSPVTGRLIVVVVVIAVVWCLFAVLASTEVVVWNGRDGWWWRGALLTCPGAVGVVAAMWVVVAEQDFALVVAPATFGIAGIAVASAAITAAIAAFIPLPRPRPH